MSTLLVDGDNVAMRALHAVPADAMSAAGVNTGACVVFMNMLARAVRENDVDRILVAFDCHDPMHPLVRKDVFPDYKAQRKPAPPGREETFGLIKDLLTALGVACAEEPSLEADDLIASAWADARQHEPQDPVLILSGDKDLLQLVDEQTVVLRPGNGSLERWDAARVYENYSLPAERLGHYLALVGDVSDNVPGVRGVGPRKAWKIVHEMMLLDGSEPFEAMVDRMADKGVWDEQQVAQADLSWVMVDLRVTPLVAPGVVMAQDLDPTPPMTPRLDEMLSTFGLLRLRSLIESGTLWRDAEDPQDALLADLETLESTKD